MIYDINEILKEGETFPPRDEIRRLDAYRVNGLLLEDEAWAALPAYDRRVKFALSSFQLSSPTAYYYDANYWLDLVEKLQELIYGDVPDLKADGGEETLKALLLETELWEKAKEGLSDFVALGDWVTKIVQTDRGLSFINVNPATWFPVVSRENVKDVKMHVLAWIALVGKDKYELHAQIHERGKFTNAAYAISRFEAEAYYVVQATKQRLVCPTYTIGKRLQKSASGFPLGVFPNGLSKDEFAVLASANNAKTRSVFGTSDFDKITAGVMEYNVRMTLKNVVLDKHSAPIMYGPQLQGDDSTAVGNYIELQNGETTGYLTWDASMQSVENTIRTLLDDVSNLSGMGSLLSSKAFGESQGYDALMIKLAPALMRTAGKRATLGKHLKKLISLLSGGYGKALDGREISLLWHDGIPTTESVRADIAQKHLATGWSMLDVLTKDYGWTKKAAEEAIERKRTETPAMPTVGVYEDENGAIE